MMDLRLLPPPLPEGSEGTDRTRINSPRLLAGEGLGERGPWPLLQGRRTTHV
jgi:hypothetical protein